MFFNFLNRLFHIISKFTKIHFSLVFSNVATSVLKDFVFLPILAFLRWLELISSHSSTTVKLIFYLYFNFFFLHNWFNIRTLIYKNLGMEFDIYCEKSSLYAGIIRSRRRDRANAEYTFLLVCEKLFLRFELDFSNILVYTMLKVY